jgi:hypothetical protein
VIGRQSYSAVPYGSAARYIGVGAALFLPVGINALTLDNAAELKNLGIIIITGLLLIAVVLFAYGIEKLRPRTIEFDATSVIWKKGRKVLWEVPLDRITSIEIKLLRQRRGRGERFILFGLATAEKTYDINVTTEFGREEKFKEGFRALCWVLMNRGVILNDHAGWAVDMARYFGKR